MTRLRILVMGAGSIGSLFGGFLAEAGNDVTLVSREKHVRAVQQNGLKIEGITKKHIMNIKAVVMPSLLKNTYDTVLLTVKAYDTRQAVSEVKTLMDDDSVLLCLQNGLGPEKIASEIIGMDRVLRGVTMNGALKKKRGVIAHTGRGETVIGELNGRISDRARTISKTFSNAGLPTKVTNDVREIVWTKTLVNSGINPFGALTGMKNGELLTIPELIELMAETVLEGKNVAENATVKIGGDPVSLMIKTAERTAQNKNSMLQDVEKGKRTEIEYINGAISELGKKRGISTPLNSLLTHLVKGLEASQMNVTSSFSRQE